MNATIFVAHTGWWWLDAIVYIVSGGAFLAICYLAPSYYRANVEPVYRAILELIQEKLNK
jgi:hypothetical protein